MEALTVSRLDWAAAAAPSPADPEDSGDRYLVVPHSRGALVVVADGVGHGPEAAAAAQLAIEVAGRSAHGSPLALLRECHQALRATRGAVVSVASFDDAERTMTWAGVGNVEGVLLRADPRAAPRQESLLLRSGVVGHELPPLAALLLGVEAGDTLVFATDGVRPEFAADLNAQVPPQRLADLILTRYQKGSDDALVLVARVRGDGA